MEDPTAPNTLPFQNNPSSDNNPDPHGNDKHPPDHPHDDHDHDKVDSSSLSLIDQMLMADDSILWDPLLSDDFLDLDNPLLNDPVLWGTPSQTGHHDNATHDYRHYEVGSTSKGGSDGKKKSDDQGMEKGREAVDNAGNHHDHDHQEDTLIMAPVQVWPPNNDNNPTVSNSSCSCCQVLREIIHTNGTHTTKFEIHGRVGLVSHAILGNHYASNDGLAPTMQDCQMLDFCRESLENIKEYMKWYLEDHRQKGYILLQDPLSFFYEVLCTGYNWVNNSVGESHAQACQAGASNQEVNPPLEVPCYAMQVPPMANQQVPSLANQQVPTLLKTELAVQRERIKSMTLGDFAKYFDTPIEEAAKQLRLCATVIKKKLRSFNISRWPYRKVRSIKRKISLWSKDLEVDNPEARARAEAEILKLQQQLDEILNGNIETLKSI